MRDLNRFNMAGCVDMCLNKICFMCEQCDGKRLKRIVSDSKECNYVQKYLGLNIVNGYLCSNCVNALNNLELKCTKLKIRCELSIRKVVDVQSHNKRDTTPSKSSQTTHGSDGESMLSKQRVVTPIRQLTPKSNRKKRLLYKSPAVHHFSSPGLHYRSSPSERKCKKMKRALFDQGTIRC